MAEKETICKEISERDTKQKKYLKIMQAMLRSPKMCDLFQKAELQRLSAEEAKRANAKAVLELRQEQVFDSDPLEFARNLVNSVENLLRPELQ